MKWEYALVITVYCDASCVVGRPIQLLLKNPSTYYIEEEAASLKMEVAD